MNHFNTPYFEKLKTDYKINLEKDIELKKSLIPSYQIILETIDLFKHYKKINIKFFNALDEKGVRAWMTKFNGFNRIYIGNNKNCNGHLMVSKYNVLIEWQDIIDACNIETIQKSIIESEKELLLIDEEITKVVNAANNLINVMLDTNIFKNSDYRIAQVIENKLRV